MAHAGVDHLRPPGGGPVAQAVAVGAEERAALDHLARDPELRLRGVVAASTLPPRGLSAHSRLVRVVRMAGAYQSLVHSQTLPAMSYRPNPLGGKEPTGAVVP